MTHFFGDKHVFSSSLRPDMQILKIYTDGNATEGAQTAKKIYENMFGYD